MLIPIPQLNITKPITGIIHIGAHECEERNDYIHYFGIDDSKIIWIEALQEKVLESRLKYPQAIIFNACLSNKDEQEVSFMVASNFQSSSILNFKTHSQEHPHVVETGRLKLHTKTLNSLFRYNELTPSHYNFMNLDIQGAELLALKGSSDILPHIDYIYCEVNTKELYENCALLPEVDDFLSKNGFTRIKTDITIHGWGDAFYVRGT